MLPVTDDKPMIGSLLDLFSEGFLIELQSVKMPITRFNALLKLLRKAITAYGRTNKVKSIQFDERLRKVVEAYNSRDRVFNGPRFKRPYAELGVTSGPTIRKYFTGTALTQLNSDNVKYLDSSKANTQVKKHLVALTIHKGYILVSDSGTLGRVTYALSQHDGHVATNNLIRIIVDDPQLRGYLYEFLQSDLGQSLMLKNAYGTNQEHLEPDIIADIPIPIPKDRAIIEQIGNAVLDSIEELEKSITSGRSARGLLGMILE